MSSGEVLEARRVMQPEFISASFNNRDTTLAGTLYLPGNVQLPIPAVVLAHGSGPVTRYAGTWITFFLEQGLERIEPGWWRRQVANMQLEPSCDVANLEIPVLWFLAEEDENVPFDSGFEALVEARKENPRLTIVTVHNAPHSFLLEDRNGKLRYTDEYREVMADWLNKLDKQ